jgi:hypothetical protein
MSTHDEHVATIREALDLGIQHKGLCLLYPETCTCFAAKTYRASVAALAALDRLAERKPKVPLKMLLEIDLRAFDRMRASEAEAQVREIAERYGVEVE